MLRRARQMQRELLCLFGNAPANWYGIASFPHHAFCHSAQKSLHRSPCLAQGLSAAAPAGEGTRLDLGARAGSCMQAQKPAQRFGKCRLIIYRMFYSDIALCRVEGLISGRVLCPPPSPSALSWAPLRVAGKAAASLPGLTPRRGPPSHGTILTRAFLDRKATEPPGPELSLFYAVLQCNSEIKSLTRCTLAEPELPRLKAVCASSRAAEAPSNMPQWRAGGSTATGVPSNPDKKIRKGSTDLPQSPPTRGLRSPCGCPGCSR